MIVVPLEKGTGRLVRAPEVTSSGFADEGEGRDIHRGVSDLVAELLRSRGNAPFEWGATNQKIRETVARHLYNATGRRPMIVPVALEV